MYSLIMVVWGRLPRIKIISKKVLTFIFLYGIIYMQSRLGIIKQVVKIKQNYP